MKRYLVTGLLALLPLAVTLWVLSQLLGLVDGVFGLFLDAIGALLPAEAVPELARLRRIPGLSLLVLACVLIFTGFLATNIAGQWLMRRWDALMHRIPIVKSIYSSVKQVSDTLFSSSGNAFREAVLVEYPRAGSWTIAFVTGRPGGEVARHLEGEWVSVYVPTTPNPTSGFFLMMPRAAVRPLTMSVDQALKYVISMGVVAPGSVSARTGRPPRAPAAVAGGSSPAPVAGEVVSGADASGRAGSGSAAAPLVLPPAGADDPARNPAG